MLDLHSPTQHLFHISGPGLTTADETGWDVRRAVVAVLNNLLTEVVVDSLPQAPTVNRLSHFDCACGGAIPYYSSWSEHLSYARHNKAVRRTVNNLNKQKQEGNLDPAIERFGRNSRSLRQVIGKQSTCCDAHPC